MFVICLPFIITRKATLGNGAKTLIGSLYNKYSKNTANYRVFIAETFFAWYNNKRQIHMKWTF